MDPAAIREWEQAAQHFAAGRFAQAGAILAAILDRDPASAQAWLALAQVDIHSGRVQQAFRHAVNAARHAPADAGFLCDVATTLMTTGAMTEGLACVERAAALGITVPSLQQRIAMQYQTLNLHDPALAWMERARVGGLRDTSSRFCMAVQLTFHGRVQEAEAELEACATAVPVLGRALVQLAQLRRQTADRNHLDLFARQLAMVAPGSEDFAALQFARYKELEDLERYRDAWEALASANATMHSLLRYDPVQEQRTFEALMRYVAEGLTKIPPVADRHAGPIPIFVVGMPRSGTTLLDRMLGNHSQVRGAGELGTFRRSLERVTDHFTGRMLDPEIVARLPSVDYAQLGHLYLTNSQWCADGRPFYIDKLPRNWLLVPLIHRALPQARILHLVRDPMDTVFSNFRSYFGDHYPYCYDMDSLAGHYHHYRRLMANWHAALPGAILDVDYAGLVTDADTELRKVFAFCGLPWEPGCADLDRNRAPVATLSAVQVRDRVNSAFSGRWHHYADALSGLRARIEGERPPLAGLDRGQD